MNNVDAKGHVRGVDSALTIMEMINRIRWHPNVDPDRYSIGYYDRVAMELRWIAFKDLDFTNSDRFSMVVRIRNGPKSNIPFHRVRVVKEDGVVIWERTVKGDRYDRD